MLIKRVYEIDPLACPNCGGTMKVVAFLERPQADVIEKILRHCGLWHATRAPPAGEDLVHGPDGHSQAANDAPRELTFVADHAIWGEAAGFREADTFGHDPVDAWYRHLAEDEPRDLTYVDEDTRLVRILITQRPQGAGGDGARCVAGFCPPHEARNRVSMPSGCQVLPREALEDGRPKQ